MQPPQSPQQFESTAQSAAQTPIATEEMHQQSQQSPTHQAPTTQSMPVQQSSTGQQPMGGSQPAGASQGLRLQDVETPQQRAVVDSVARAQQVCEWCADQCLQRADQQMIECIRLCEDVSELSETALALVPRNSRFSRRVLQTFVQAARACQQECGKHQHAHCQECVQILGQAITAVEQHLTTGQQGSQSGQQRHSSGQMQQHQPGL